MVSYLRANGHVFNRQTARYSGKIKKREQPLAHPMYRTTTWRLNLPQLALAMLCTQAAANSLAAEPIVTESKLAAEFTETVLPLVTRYCLDCHGADQPEAMFDLSGYSDLKAVAADHPHWALVLA